MYQSRRMTQFPGFRLLPPVLGLLVLAGAIFGLHGAFHHLHAADVLAALAATPHRQVAHALLLLGASLTIMCAYDLPGILFASRLAALPELKRQPWRAALAAFCAYALSHVLGAPALSAAAIRLRLYAQWRVPPAAIARIIAISGSAFSFGLCALLGVILLLRPREIPLFGHAIPPLLLRAAGLALCGGVFYYVFFAQSRLSLPLLLRKKISLPGTPVAAAQVLLSCLDISVSGGILYVVLPDTPGLAYAHVLGIYLAAFAGGLLSGLPAGLGVFDSLLLLGLAPLLRPAAALGALLLFRVMYFLAPALAASLCYGAHELWVTAFKRTKT